MSRAPVLRDVAGRGGATALAGRRDPRLRLAVVQTQPFSLKMFFCEGPRNRTSDTLASSHESLCSTLLRLRPATSAGPSVRQCFHCPRRLCRLPARAAPCEPPWTTDRANTTRRRSLTQPYPFFCNTTAPSLRITHAAALHVASSSLVLWSLPRCAWNRMRGLCDSCTGKWLLRHRHSHTLVVFLPHSVRPPPRASGEGWVASPPTVSLASDCVPALAVTSNVGLSPAQIATTTTISS